MNLHFNPTRRSSLTLSALCAALVASSAGCFFPDGGAGTGSSGTGAGGSTFTSCPPVEASCPLSQACLARTTNLGASKFGMRISELTIRTPAALTLQGGSILGLVFDDAVSPGIKPCLSSDDEAPTAWLLGFDLGQKTLTMGSALAPSPAQTQFAFLDEMFGQGAETYHVAPVVSGLVQNADGSFSTTTPEDLAFPLFTFANQGPTIIPFHALTASNITVSASHDCVGNYDPAVFDPRLSCEPTVKNQSFRHAGTLQGYFSLEEADTIVITALSQTFCAALAGDTGTLDTNVPVKHCSRTNGAIDFKGDWCSATNAPATATCADAVHVTGDFAASAVQIQQ